jgi:hypothetical protein
MYLVTSYAPTPEIARKRAPTKLKMIIFLLDIGLDIEQLYYSIIVFLRCACQGIWDGVY